MSPVVIRVDRGVIQITTSVLIVIFILHVHLAKDALVVRWGCCKRQQKIQVQIPVAERDKKTLVQLTVAEKTTKDTDTFSCCWKMQQKIPVQLTAAVTDNNLLKHK